MKLVIIKTMISEENLANKVQHELPIFLDAPALLDNTG